ncbi:MULTISPECIES: flagellar protein FlaG [Brevibacillus]|uniref:flagellar protein FlaG n=1 Tax=Brevibacillus TaxID=55080 RepID=UPI000271C3B9|nr:MULTISPECIES: flagellar protein FlaG [Brevibacillus]EJL46883.1 flagellar protein FlaG [Brevibacillus sp. CF112]MED1822661.1 flagellar protein FlaG [Brevibacillus agri]
MEIKGVSSSNIEARDTGGATDQVQQNRQGGDLNNVVAYHEKAYSKEDIEKELDTLNKVLESKGSHLKFVLHDKLQKYYVQVIDNNTDEVLKEIPTKKVMDIVANFYEKLGFIVDEKI